MGFWDDPDVKSSTDWFKFESVGDVAEGTIAKLGKKVWADGSVGIEIMFSEEDVPTVTASQTLLKQALFALKPAAGDKIHIEYAALEKRPGGKTLKRFKVALRRGGDGEVEEIDQTDTATAGAPAKKEAF
jgi:hypothetical protein